MKRHFGKWLTAAALAVGCTVMTANAFADTNGHWAESAINKWSGEYGIIQGYDDGTFRPDKSITRGAFAGILDRFLHFQNASPADTFSDTAGTYWEDAILKLHASGIYLGNQGAALPSSTITRQQAVAMIGRAFRIAPETAAPDYTDTDQIAEYAMAYVGEFEARGYLTDSAAGTFRPTDPITRGGTDQYPQQHGGYAGEGDHHCDEGCFRQPAHQRGGRRNAEGHPDRRRSDLSSRRYEGCDPGGLRDPGQYPQLRHRRGAL